MLLSFLKRPRASSGTAEAISIVLADVVSQTDGVPMGTSVAWRLSLSAAVRVAKTM